MAVSSASIIGYTTPLHKINLPGISDEVRDRLEWTWGLGHGRLDEHLGRFAVDPHLDIMDETVLVFPHSDIIRDIWFRTRFLSGGIRRPNIQKVYKGTKAFQYLVLPIDLSSPLPARTVVSEIPPHLVLCVTYGKLMKTWGHLPGKDFATVRDSLIQRSKMVGSPGATPALDEEDFTIMPHLHRKWSMIDRVPSSFLSEDSDGTRVEEDEGPDTKTHPDSDPESSSDFDSDSDSSMDWEVGSSASCYHEPKRRLLPCELEQDFNSIPIDDEDDAISSDSHMTGVEDPDEFAKASMARGDYEEDGEWLEGMAKWAKGTSGATEQILLNDGQIPDDPREQPRVATSLDLDKPDYLSKSTKRTTT
ncbi:hypothetical protein B0H11DRAFT_2078174 [Mycena galericulata]|nr:hypothetical protein B0H11DRAFT_2078174 [Mycena galericulata]